MSNPFSVPSLRQLCPPQTTAGQQQSHTSRDKVVLTMMPNRTFSLAVALVLLAATACLCSVTADDGKASAAHTAARKRVMPWMCLERCGDNSTSITAQLHVRPLLPLSLFLFVFVITPP
jgi:hypothetical protein